MSSAIKPSMNSVSTATQGVSSGCYELLDSNAVSDNKCQEEMTRGASDTDRGPYPNWNLCLTEHPNLKADMDTVFLQECD